MRAAGKARAMLVASAVAFGTIGVFRREIALPSSLIAQVRGLVGALFLLAWFALRRRRPNGALIRRHLPRLALAGAMIGVNWILLFEAFNHTTVAAATLAYYMAPVFVVLATPLLFRERLTARKALCTAAAFAGMVLVSGVLTGGIDGAAGIGLGLGAAACYACVILLNKGLTEVPATERTMVELGSAGVTLLPYVLLTVDMSALSPAPKDLWLLLVVGIFHTGVCYVLYFGSMNTLSAQTVAILSYIDPITSVLLSALLLGERLDIAGIAGCVLIIASAVWSELEPPPARAD